MGEKGWGRGGGRRSSMFLILVKAYHEDPISGLQEQAIDCIQHEAPPNLQIQVSGFISVILIYHIR